MLAVNFYASCFVSRENSVGKKLIRLDWEKAVYRPLFTLANTLIMMLENYDDMMRKFLPAISWKPRGKTKMIL